MVPCLGCGRSFCRLCDPPKGAGQYCPVCYKEQLERLSGTEEKPEPAKKKVARRRKREKPERSLRQKLLVPVDWIEDTTGAFGKKIAATGKWVGALPVRFGKFVARVAIVTTKGVRRHFPVGLAPRELLEGDPPFRATWSRLLAFVLGGSVLWIIGVASAKTRNPAFSIGVSITVAAGVVWAFGSKYGIKVAIIATGLALLSLMLAELSVQLLYRAGFIIKRLDLQRTGLISLNKPSMFYRAFAFKLVVYRLVPGAVIAFLIGWWPLRARLSWVGFKGRKVGAVRMSSVKARD